MMHTWKQGCEPRKPGVGDLMLAVTDTVIAAQNAVVAAESFGLGSCYIGDIMENCEEQRRLLCLPDYVFPAAMLVLGWPTEQQKQRPKPNGVNRSISCMRIHTAIWTEKNYVKCLHTNVKTVHMKSGVMHFVIVNITLIFPKK